MCYRITKELRFTGTSYVYLVQTPSLLKQQHLMQADQDQVQGVRKYLLQGDSTTSQGNPCQCTVTVTVKKCFLIRVPVCTHCLLSCHLSITGKSLALSSLHPSDVYTHWQDPPDPPILQAEQYQLSQSLLIRDVAVPSSPLGPSTGLAPAAPSTPSEAIPVLHKGAGSLLFACQ